MTAGNSKPPSGGFLMGGKHVDLSNIRTCDLVAELSKREGVSTKEFGPYENFQVEGEGPMIILIVED